MLAVYHLVNFLSGDGNRSKLGGQGMKIQSAAYVPRGVIYIYNLMTRWENAPRLFNETCLGTANQEIRVFRITGYKNILV